MDSFNYYNPTRIIFGKNSIKNIGKEISDAGISKVLIVYGGGSIKSNGVFDTISKSLSKHAIEYIECPGVRPNPTLEHSLAAAKLAKENNVGAVLAVGGGSVIDEAKTITTGFYVDNIWDVFEKKVPITQALPLFTVLTLSGTCSEMDPFAVLSNEAEQKKWGSGSPLWFPKVSIIDPTVQCSLPWNQTVNGAIDAIAHTQEFYFNGTNQEMSSSIGEAIIKTVIKSVDALHIDPASYAPRADLAWAATLALNGISGAGMKGGDWSSHGIEHGISALFPEVAHGAGLAVVFPAWIKYCMNENPAQFNRWAKNIWGVDSCDEAIGIMKAKFKSWGAPVSLKDLNIDEKDIENIAKNATMNGSLGAVKRLDYNDVLQILRLAS